MLSNNYSDQTHSGTEAEPSAQQAPRSTLDPAEAFLEARQVSKEFKVPGGTIRVDTRIKVSRSPWTVRSVVLENDTEIQEGPFAPIQQEFDSSTADHEDLASLQLDFARQALAGHLARCKQVERALNGKAPRVGKGAGPIIAIAVALLLAIGGTAGFLLWKQSKAKATSVAQMGKEEAGGDPIPKTTASDSTSENPAAVTATETVSPIIKKARPSPSTMMPPPFFPGAAEKKTSRPAVGAPAARKDSAAPSEPPQRIPQKTGGREIVHQLQPANYRLGRLQSGATAYVDSATIYAEVPADLQGLLCIKTANASQSGKGSLSFQLTSSARVYVGHDRRIHKKPSWLQSFSSTGEQLTFIERAGEEKPSALGQLAETYNDANVALDTEPSQKNLKRLQRVEAASRTASRVSSLLQGENDGPAVFDLFGRDYPAGPVILGANTEWNALTRLVRVGVPKKMGMYIVCVKPRS